MKKHLIPKILVLALLVTLIAGTGVSAAGSNEADPLVTLSYLTDVYRPSVLKEAEEKTAAREQTLRDDFTRQTGELLQRVSVPAKEPAVNEFRTVTLEAGQSLAVPAGSEILFLSGSAKSDVGLTDTTSGIPVGTGAPLEANHLYVALEDCNVLASGPAKLLYG